MTAPRTVPPVRFEPTEKEFTAMVIELARRLGWAVLHIRPGMTANGRWATQIQGDGKGWPDLFMVRGRRAIVAELKVGKNKLEPDQETWLGRLSAADIPAYVWRPDDLETEILGVLR